MKPTLFVTVSTGFALRNLFPTGLVERLDPRFRVVVVTTPLFRDALVAAGWDERVEIATVEDRPEPWSWKLARQARKKLYFEARGAATERIWATYGSRPLYQRLAAPLLRSAVRMGMARPLLRALNWTDTAVNRSGVLSDVLRTSGPSALLATHANTYFEESVLRSARAAGLPAALMVLSWDHLSTKVVLNDLYQRILVWTPRQKDEILGTYDGYREEDIGVVGIPYLDTYRRTEPVDRATWARRYGLDPERRVLVFYTMPQIRHRDQHLIVERLAEEVRRGERLPPDLQILVKCHPLDDNDVYDDVVAAHAFVAREATTKDRPGSSEVWVPRTDEIERARDCLAHADVTVNIYSTVTIEAALYDRPIVHVGFDLRPLPEGRIPCREYYRFTHFRPVVETGAAAMAESMDELVAHVAEGLARPDLRREERARLVAEFAGPLDGGLPGRVLAEVERLLAGEPATRRAA